MLSEPARAIPTKPLAKLSSSFNIACGWTEKLTRVVLAIVCGIIIVLLLSGVALAAPEGPITNPDITVSLPIADPCVSVGGNFEVPMTTTQIDSTTTGGANYVGFQGDFTFDSAVINFATSGTNAPLVEKAGVTGGITSSDWNLNATILNTGPGTIRTLRFSAFNNAFNPIATTGTATLFNLRPYRAGASPTTVLTWAASPNQFIYIDDNLTSYAPTQTNGQITITTCCHVTEGFADITTLIPSGWRMQNNSQPGPGATGWFQGSTAALTSQSGAPNSYIAANYDNGTGASTLSNWLLTPALTLVNGGQFTFWTRTMSIPAYADRLQVRLSTNGTSSNVGSSATDVGDFTTLLLDINPTYTLTGYPNVWTQFTLTLSGLVPQSTGRLAFRYFVENGGPSGTNSDYIGIDSVEYACATPTPTPTPSPAVTPTPTPTPTPTFNISGAISYCSNPVPGPVQDVTLILTGSASGSTLTSAAGNYQFTLYSGGTYTVTPSKAALLPGSSGGGINTVDVLATQRHFTSCQADPAKCLTGCRLIAGDVTGNNVVDTVDVIAIQRFFLGLTTGIANVGKYKFTPASRVYSPLVSDQPSQNYDTLVLGDVASHFVE